MALQVLRFDDPSWRDPAAPVPEELRREMKDFVPPGGLLLVGYDPEAKEKVIATAGFRRVTAEVCEAARVVVFWGHQGRSTGRAMMHELLKQARAAGYRGMRAQAPENVPALTAFYEKMGFARSPAEFQQAGFVRLERTL